MKQWENWCFQNLPWLIMEISVYFVQSLPFDRRHGACTLYGPRRIWRSFQRVNDVSCAVFLYNFPWLDYLSELVGDTVGMPQQLLTSEWHPVFLDLTTRNTFMKRTCYSVWRKTEVIFCPPTRLQHGLSKMMRLPQARWPEANWLTRKDNR